jgi:hypothetical protein
MTKGRNSVAGEYLWRRGPIRGFRHRNRLACVPESRGKFEKTNQAVNFRTILSSKCQKHQLVTRRPGGFGVLSKYGRGHGGGN